MSVHKTDDGFMFHASDDCSPEFCGQPYRWNDLAVYNAERHRGIVHTPEYDERMAKEQEAFDRHQHQQMLDRGCKPTMGGGWLCPPEKKRRRRL